jgi:DNA-binding MarR family transcriptional regulator
MHNEFEIADRLHSAAIHLLRRVRRVDLATGLSAAKLSALSVVVFAGPISLKELAAAEQVRPPSMTRTVGELEADGLVTREADDSDGRVTRIRATSKGTRLFQRGRDARINLLAGWLKELDRGDLAVLDQASQVLNRLFSSSMSGRAR